MKRFLLFLLSIVFTTCLYANQLSCGTPVINSVTQITNNSAVVTFSSVADATSYAAQVSLNDTTWTSGFNGTGNVITLTGLTACKKYYVRVWAYCTNLSGTPSASYTFITTGCTTGCGIPSSVSFSQITNTSAVVTFSAVTGAISYVTKISPDNITWTIACNSPNLSCPIQDLTACKKYYIRVKAVCSNTEGDATSSYSFTTTGCAPNCPKPVISAVLDIGNTGAIVKIDTVTGGNYYKAEISTNDTTWGSPIYFTGNLGTISGLTACKRYYVRVTAICGNYFSTPSTSFSFMTTGCPPDCGTPVINSVTQITDSSAVVYFTQAIGALAYIVEISTNDTTWTTTSTSGSGNVITLLGLTWCKHYFVRVKVYCGNGVFGTPSASFSFTTTGCTIGCGIPGNVAVTQITKSSAVITFGSVTGASSYITEISTNNTNWTTACNSPNLSCPIQQLDSCKKYYIRVRSLCNGIEGTPSTSIYFFTTGCPPDCGKPVINSVTQITNTGAVVSFSSAVGALSYFAEISLNDTVWTSAASGSGNVLTLSQLTACKKYYVRVKAYCGNGIFGAPSASYAFTTTGCTTNCGIPGNVSVSQITNTSAVVLFGEVAGATSYITQISTDSITWTNACSGPNLSCPIQSLTACKKYYVRVRTVCNNIESAFSTVISFKTTGCDPVCPKPVILSILDIGNTTAIVKIDTVSGANYYKAEISTNDSTWGSPIYFSGNLGTITGLTACKKYYVRVTSVCGNYFSLPSASYSFTTTGCTTNCGTPTELSASDITANSARIKWALQTGSQNYKIQYRRKGTTTWIQKDAGTNNFYDLTGLVASKTYQVRVKSKCNGVFSAWSAIYEFTTTPQRLGNTDLVDNGHILLFPNPASSQLFVSYTGPDMINASIEIFDITGRSIKQLNVPLIAGNDIPVDVSGISDGTYFVHVKGEGFTGTTEKLIISK